MASTRAAAVATGGNLLLSDLRTGYLLLNELRYRAIVGTFGVSRQQANLVTLVGVSMVAQALQDRATRLLRVTGPPMAMDGALTVAGLRGVLCQVAGVPSADVPGAGALLAMGILGGAFAPTLTRALRGLRADSLRLSTDFHHRYGYLVDPGHRRARRARTRDTAQDGGTPT
ncbi:MAG TPA: hypothetical protein VHX62_06090 [Solirubrobacteraceae bacterium]|nr:hypothetical protein [Solirubrobacteraceae bacterium]